MSNSFIPNACLSLIIPSYNRGDLIGETILSALTQTVPFVEIIVVDDGSTDNTLSVLAEFGDRIKVIEQANGGVQRARNVGVAHARGQYIVLCDSDDLLEKDYVAMALGALRLRPETDAFYCNFRTFTGDEIHNDKFSQGPADWFDGAQRDGDIVWDVPDIYARTVTFQPLFMSGCLIRKAFYEELGGFDTQFNNVGGEDWEFTLRCLALGNVTVAQRPLARIRKHGSNDSADPIRMVRGTAQILEYALQAHPKAQQYRDHIRRGIEERRLSVFHVAFSHGQFDVAEEMLGLLEHKPTDANFILKRTITGLPGWMRTPLWKLSQQRSAAPGK
ncbi:MAG: glycosyltransferase [Pseudomonadota bacterium]